MKDVLNLVNGKDRPGEGALLDNIDPSTGTVIATLREASEGEVEEAVAVAERVFEAGNWSQASAWPRTCGWLHSSGSQCSRSLPTFRRRCARASS